MTHLDERAQRYLELWDGHANVRSRARFRVQRDFRPASVLAPAALPQLDDPRVIALGQAARERVQLQRCYDILQEIAYGEARVVGAAAVRLSGPEGEGLLPAAARQALMSVAVDENYHAFAARDAIAQMEAITGVAGRTDRTYSSLEAAMAEALASVSVLARPLLTLLTIGLVENIVTDDLVELIRATDDESPFYQFNREHLRDEGRHSALFRLLLAEIWPRQSAGVRRVVAAGLARFLDDHFRTLQTLPRQRLRSILVAAGLDPEAADDLCRGPGPAPLDHPFWRNMRACLEATGLADDPLLHDGLAAAGWPTGPADAAVEVARAA